MEDLKFEDLFSSSPQVNTQKEDRHDDKHEEKHEGDDEPDADEMLNPNASKVTLEDFKILKLVGQGAYGKVFQAKKVDTGTIYALKALKKDFLVYKSKIHANTF